MFTAISTLELDGEIDRVISLTSIGLGGSISHPNQSDKTISQPHMITQVNTHLLPPLHTHTPCSGAVQSRDDMHIPRLVSVPTVLDLRLLTRGL